MSNKAQHSLLKKIQNFFLSNFEQKYQIGKYTIVLPAKHTLARFQKKHVLYDRFIPILAEYLSSDNYIIDVGANVGDTAFMMLENAKNPIICVEPSEKFFTYLASNIKLLTQQDAQRIQIHKNLIGTDKLKGSLQHQKGTASLKITQQEPDNKITLNNLIEQTVLDNKQVVLIKVDTDGFDFDVLLSGLESIEKYKPVLFWENQFDNATQLEGYCQLYHSLQKLGYHTLSVFDNFGNLLLQDVSFDVLQQLNSYVDSLNRKKSTRTVYYFDIVASSNLHSPSVNKAIENYKKNWLS